MRIYAFISYRSYFQRQYYNKYMVNLTAFLLVKFLYSQFIYLCRFRTVNNRLEVLSIILIIFLIIIIGVHKIIIKKKYQFIKLRSLGVLNKYHIDYMIQSSLKLLDAERIIKITNYNIFLIKFERNIHYNFQVKMMKCVRKYAKNIINPLRQNAMSKNY